MGEPALKHAEQTWVYVFGGGTADGDASMKNLLGGKGANLAEMAKLGLPVPPASPSRPLFAPRITSLIANIPPRCRRRWTLR